MEIYFPEVYDTIEAPLTPEQVQVYSDFIHDSQSESALSGLWSYFSRSAWLRDAFLLDANFTYPLLLAGEEPIDAEVHFVDLEHPIEE